MKRIILGLLAPLLIWCGTTASVQAGSDRRSNEWHYMLAPMFLWGISVDGTAQIGPVEAPLDLDFTDNVLENLGAVFTVHFEAHKNDLVLFSEYQYVKLEPGASTPGGGTVDIDFTIQAGELGTGYRVATWGNTEVEPIVGARWAYQKLETKAGSGVELISAKEDWWDVFGGIRLWTYFNEEWTLLSRLDIGAGDSDFVWNASLILDYRFNDWGAVFFGYRWLDYDFDSGSGRDTYAYDALQQGPLAGLQIHW
ncbi:hypothetical protein [Desulfosediminicola sp.]|uniref:hypothetical protein n=1 Tax=Desulfosediminicola sp. TaxID=2886825 RepID=UPI003AF30CF0